MNEAPELCQGSGGLLSLCFQLRGMAGLRDFVFVFVFLGGVQMTTHIAYHHERGVSGLSLRTHTKARTHAQTRARTHIYICQCNVY